MREQQHERHEIGGKLKEGGGEEEGEKKEKEGGQKEEEERVDERREGGVYTPEGEEYGGGEGNGEKRG